MSAVRGAAWAASSAVERGGRQVHRIDTLDSSQCARVIPGSRGVRRAPVPIACSAVVCIVYAMQNARVSVVHVQPPTSPARASPVRSCRVLRCYHLCVKF